ncbi:hypothetical protein HYZ99_04990 [Candidatus Peregrinibacteria bacterium]|nr:hypothetical protein [Candidatus Peregrinibacteria bacterium]
MRKKKDDSKPATKGDLKKFSTKDDLKKSEERMHQIIKSELQKNDRSDEVMRHFDVRLEEIRHDLKGANKDQIEVLKDHDQDHQRRIVRLEHATGVA